MQRLLCAKKCLLVLVFFVLANSLASQSYKYRFRMINLPEEFKNQHISMADEDAAGMLWFVTNSGLHRYDGNQVLTFDMQSKPALPDLDIVVLIASGRNRIWLLIQGKLVCFNLEQWSTHIIPFRRQQPTVLPEYSITSIAEDPDGTVYAGCGNRLYRVEGDSLELVTQIEKQTSGKTGKFFIDGIYKPSANQLLLTTSNGEMSCINYRNLIFSRPTPVLPQNGNAFVNSSGNHKSGKYLVNVTGTGACMVDLERMTTTSLTGLAKKFSLRNSKYFLSAVSNFGKKQAVFYSKTSTSTNIGLLVYNPDENLFEDLSDIYPTALKNNQLRFTRYKNGHIIIPVKGAIATVSYTNSPLDVFANSLENANSIRSIYKEPHSNLLMGSYLYNFVQFNETSSVITRRSGTYVYAMRSWNKDTILAATEGAGLNWYLPASNKFVSLPCTDADGQALNSTILCLQRESDTSILVGSTTGFYLLNPYTLRIVNSSRLEGHLPLWHSTIYEVLKVGSSTFFATREGLFKYNLSNNKWTHLLTSTTGNYANTHFSCLRLAQNQVWAGTVGNGMLVLDTSGKLLRTITTADGLVGNVVFSNPLCRNFMFVGTRTGLSIINLTSGTISNYSSEYYLPADEFNRSAWYVNGDTVYLGTINGFIRIDVKRLQQQQEAVTPGVCFSSFNFSSNNISHAEYSLPYRRNVSLMVPAGVSNFSIGFGGISEISYGLKLFYRLKPGQLWQQIGQRREITFVDLAPDKYNMQIAVRLPDGKFMENILALPIVVQPRFYQTSWWKLLLFSVALGLVWLSVKYRERALRKEEQLRSRIAGDLHDEVGSALTRIYFQAGKLSSNNGNGNNATIEAIHQIASSSQDALSSMSDMVWSIDAVYDTAADMVARIRDYIARLRDEVDFEFNFTAEGDYEKLHLSQVVRQNLLLIFKEAVNNAIKHGIGKKVRIRLLLNETTISLQVINSFSPGMPHANQVQGGHGLNSMQVRARKIKATLDVTQTNDLYMVQLNGKPF